MSYQDQNNNNHQPSIRQPSAQNKAPGGPLPSFLRNRLDIDSFGGIKDFARSSSAPPTQLMDPTDNMSEVNDLRAKPEYAAYFYSNSRLDPRLPPPIYAPGQSWQMWSNSHASLAAEVEWGLGRTANGSYGEFIKRPDVDYRPANSGTNYNQQQLQQQQQQPGSKSPPGSPGRRKNLVDMIQEDFPRTPSPVFGLKQTADSATKQTLNQTVNGSQDELSADFQRLSSRTPPPVSYGTNPPPPRSSSTPPVLQNKMRSAMENPFVVNTSAVHPNHSPYVDRLTAAMQHVYIPEDEYVFPGLQEEKYQQQPYGYPQMHQSYVPPPGYHPQQSQSTWTGTTIRKSMPVEYGSAPVGRAASRSLINQQPGVLPPELNVLHHHNHHNQQHHQQQPQLARRPSSQPQSIVSSPPVSQKSTKEDNGNRSAVLEEFRASKNKKFDLQDILGYVVEFSSDQHGSRFIQQKLECSSMEEKMMVFDELLPNAFQLMTDVFGNYVIQKFFEFGSDDQRSKLCDTLRGNVLSLSLQMYGCRVVQKALDWVDLNSQVELVNELSDNVLQCVKDQNGNHVIQKAIEKIPFEKVAFIVEAFQGQVKELAMHQYGCRVMQRIFEFCSESETEILMVELRKEMDSLIQDQYGNYVIQHVLEKGNADDRKMVTDIVKNNVLALSKHKFASNVVEKCITSSNSQDRQFIIEEVVKIKSDGTNPLLQMTKDQFANYVIQKMLDVSDKSQRDLLISRIRPHFSSLRKFTYGKHIISKIEKLSMEQ